MNPDDNKRRPIWWDDAKNAVKVIDQRRLPHEYAVLILTSVNEIIAAIQEMVVRGAPLIGVTAAYAMVTAVLTADNHDDIEAMAERLKNARPTAVNLAWAVDRMLTVIRSKRGKDGLFNAAKQAAMEIDAVEVDHCRRIGRHGLPLVADASRRKNGAPVNILTHCNAGWLACVEYGTATAPMYAAFEAGIDIHIWVDETRPLNQGARLTCWELGNRGIPHTLITDNAGGHLMQHGQVDMVIVGSDRSTHTGDVANKIGTYLKALAARDNGIPFYVALPSSTFDWELTDGITQIPIELRNPDEVRYVQGLADGKLTAVLISPPDSPAANYAFDVTPARLVTGFITERGVCDASRDAIMALFPDRQP